MPRGTSIHIGVNHPEGLPALRFSEAAAWRMAALAVQAGYDAVTLLRGPAATCAAVRDALTRAAESLQAGDTLLVTYCGHGTRQRDVDPDERDGRDEGWCLADTVLRDDDVGGCWERFRPGVRIVLVMESCYAAGNARDDEFFFQSPVFAGRPPSPAFPGAPRGEPGELVRSCVEPPHDPEGIQASVLVLAASGEEQPAQDGLFSRHLLKVWDGGAFQGSYCELIERVGDEVLAERPCQNPQVRMLGAADPAFALEPAFHLADPATRNGPVQRSGSG